MTQKEAKELILKDISGRLPYGLTVQISLFRNDGIKRDIDLDPHVTENIWELIDKYHALPYLRPMSSMTEEEKKEYDVFCIKPYLGIDEEMAFNFIDWLNKKMFDYRGLIPMGLALEAPKDMYSF